MQFFHIIWQTILSAPWYTYYVVIKYVFIGLTIIVALGFFILLPHAWRYGKVPFRWKNTPRGHKELKDTDVFRRRWEGILKNSESAPPESLFHAIGEVDTLINEVLQEMGLPGEHLADRLESLNPEEIKSLERLWRAHSMKNNLANTPGFTLTDHQARVVLGDYEAFLREVGVVQN